MRDRHDIATSFLNRLADPGYRLQGENPATATLQDARRWARTYEELIQFKRELLDVCQKLAERADPQVARAIRDTDIILLEVQVSRFEQKRDYWKIRATELAGNGRGGHN
jgi:cob(I)alamin adenosyltransferase